MTKSNFISNINWYLLLLLCSFGVEGVAYNYLPIVKSFDKKEYNAGRQNWDVELDEDGIVYFANNRGLLRNIYGVWQLTPTANNDLVRSLYIDNDTIWSGGSVNFGYFLKNASKDLEYTNLGAPQGGSVWNIEKINNKVYFQTESLIQVYNTRDKSLEQVSVEHGFYGIAKWRNKPWVVTRTGQLGYLEGNKLVEKCTLQDLKDIEVRKLFLHNNSLHLLLFDGRIFKYDGKDLKRIELPDFLDGKASFSAFSYDPNVLCIGTISDGFIMVDEQDNKVVASANSDNKLIDNTVLSLAKDNAGNVWLGLDYGIAHVELQNVIKPIFDQGATYFIEEVGEMTYLATNKGLFASSGNSPFKSIKGSEGQVWRLRKNDEQLMICHNIGLLSLKGNQLLHLFNDDGVLDVACFEETDYLIMATYNGLFFSKNVNNAIEIQSKLPDNLGPKVYFDKVNNCIWARNYDEGLRSYQINSNNELIERKYPQMKQFFPADDEILFYDYNKLYEFENEEFVAVSKIPLNTIKGGGLTSIDIEKNGNLVAYVQNSVPNMLVNLYDGSYHSYDKILRSLSGSLIENHEFVDLYNGELRIATDRGVVSFNPESDVIQNNVTEPIISKLIVWKGESVKDEFYFPFKSKAIKLPSGDKDMMVHFGVNHSSDDNVEYRYKLWPYDKVWSAWDRTDYSKSYSRLKGGEYEFMLECRLNDAVLDTQTISIYIEKYWYQTRWIYVLYSLIFAICIMFTVLVMNRITRSRIKQEQIHHDRNVTKKTISIKNEQLLQYAEIIGKKNEFLMQVKDGLARMRNSEAKQWERKILEEVGNEKKNFFFHKLFSELHQDFITRLTDKHPNLTPHDVRILSFIRINLGTREIANLMNISSKSVDINRYRIRKKLELPHETDLNIYIREL